MVHEYTRISFLHYWSVSNAEQLAKGLKSALEKTAGIKNMMQMWYQKNVRILP